jgi:tetratricopeptide (TPR) repeat protein
VSRRALVVVTLVGCSGLFALLGSRYDVVQDDAYISLVYSQSLVNGDGLVFNPGERVEGYTNFSWVMLLTVPHVFGIDAVATARLLGVLCTAGLMLLSWRLSASLSTRPGDSAHLAAPCILAANGALAFWTLSGMETAAFALLITAGATRYLRSGVLDITTAILFGLATLTRPEGWMFFALTAIHQMICLLWTPGGRHAALRQAWRRMLALAAFVGTVLPHLLFRWSYYGHLLPNTFYAKTGISLTYVTHGLRYTGKFLVDYGLWGVALTAVLVPLWRQRSRAKAAYLGLLIFANVIYVTLVGGDTLPESRLYLPIVGLLAAVLIEGARVALLRLCGRRLAPAIFLLLLLSTMAHSVIGPDKDLLHARDASMAHNAKLFELVGFARDAGTTANLLASTAIGIPRYHTQAAVLDLVGLTDETIAHDPHRLAGIHDDHILRNYHTPYVMDREPDAILFITGMRPGTPAERALFLSQRFRRDYRLTYLQDHRPLYIRRDGPPHEESLFADGRFIEWYAEALAVIGADPARAMRLLQQSIDVGPADFAMPHCWLGRMHFESGDLAQATVHLRRALDMDDTVVMAWAHLALIAALEDRANEAVRLARTAVDLAPQSHFCRYVSGRALLSASRPAEAARELSLAIEFGGAQSMDALYRLGLAAEQQGDFAAARAAWSALLGVQNDHLAARQALRRVTH